MHTIEPFFKWKQLYSAEEDPQSPFYGRTYSEFEFSNTIYNYYIHPQWDEFGSQTLYLKIIFCDYTDGYAIIELIGEWNDLLYNDIMYLKRDLIDQLIPEGITKFILLGQHVFNFHGSDDAYYEEWIDDLEDGWVALLQFREHVLTEMKHTGLSSYLIWDDTLDEIAWHKLNPQQVYNLVQHQLSRYLG